MKILLLLSALASACMMRVRHFLIWSIAPPGAIFSGNPPLQSLRQNDRSSMDKNAFNLCRIAAMGDIFSSGGGLSLMVSHSITRAWFVLIFSLISSAKCWIASGDKADWCGPRSIASSMSARIHGLPVLVGHPNCAQSIKMAAAGCSTARPAGHIELWYAGLNLFAAWAGRICVPSCIVRKGVGCSACCKAHLLLRFSVHICFLFRIPHMPPAGSLKVLCAPARWGGIWCTSQTKIYNLETNEFVSNPPFSKKWFGRSNIATPLWQEQLE